MKYITKINPDPGKKGYYNTVNKGEGEGNNNTPYDIV